MVTKYFLMSGIPGNVEHAEVLSKEFGNGYAVQFLFKSQMKYSDLLKYLDAAKVDEAKTAAIIDDDVSIPGFFAAVLKKKGIDARTFNCGRAFLDDLHDKFKSYDLVFCDTDMPEILGPDVLRAYHKLSQEKVSQEKVGVNYGSNIGSQA